MYFSDITCCPVHSLSSVSIYAGPRGGTFCQPAVYIVAEREKEKRERERERERLTPYLDSGECNVDIGLIILYNKICI